MRRMLLILPLAAAALFAAGCAATGTATGDTNTGGESEKTQPESIDDYDLATRVADWGRENGHAGALAVASRVMAGVTVEGRAMERDGGPGEPVDKAPAAAMTSESLRAEAERMAAGDATAMRVVGDVVAMGIGTRGRVGGAVYAHYDCVRALTTDVYNATFRKGQPAIVTAIGDHDTDLDLYIYDEHGNLIASDTDYTDSCIVRWVPRWTGPFQIRVKNLGSVANCYTMSTN